MNETDISHTAYTTFRVALISDRTGETVCSGSGDTQQEARDNCVRQLWSGRQSVQHRETLLRSDGFDLLPSLMEMRGRLWPKSRCHVVTTRYVTEHIFTETKTAGRLYDE